MTRGAGGVETLRPRSASSRTALETPWALKMTVAPAGTSSSSSTKMAPWPQVVADEFVAPLRGGRRWGAEFFQGAFDDGDGAFDAGAEKRGVGENYLHYMIPMISTSKRMGLPAMGG